jgi:hypothetical protein
LKKIFRVILIVLVIAVFGIVIFCIILNDENPGIVEGAISVAIYGNTRPPIQFWNDYFDIYDYSLIANGRLSPKSKYYKKVKERTQRVNKFSKEFIDMICIYKKAWDEIEGDAKINEFSRRKKESKLKIEIENLYKTQKNNI